MSLMFRRRRTGGAVDPLETAFAQAAWIFDPSGGHGNTFNSNSDLTNWGVGGLSAPLTFVRSGGVATVRTPGALGVANVYQPDGSNPFDYTLGVSAPVNEIAVLMAVRSRSTGSTGSSQLYLIDTAASPALQIRLPHSTVSGDIRLMRNGNVVTVPTLTINSTTTRVIAYYKTATVEKFMGYAGGIITTYLDQANTNTFLNAASASFGYQGQRTYAAAVFVNLGAGLISLDDLNAAGLALAEACGV